MPCHIGIRSIHWQCYLCQLSVKLSKQIIVSGLSLESNNGFDKTATYDFEIFCQPIYSMYYSCYLKTIRRDLFI